MPQIEPPLIRSLSKPTEPSLAGQVLIAMPGLKDPGFDHSVIYMCQHDHESAMGLVLNHPLKGLSFTHMLDELEIEWDEAARPVAQVYHGGPVKSDRGFVLHSLDYMIDDATLNLIPLGEDQAFIDGLGLTASRDILVDLAKGQGPRQSLIALGYAGWSAGQLEFEIRENAWLTAPASANLIFGKSADMWQAALTSLGVSPQHLSGHAGQA